ncbi:perlucin-like protein [Mya arenaria]|uniref:perlucin-like protein n=1 Tax=Mya arenaria TaxID=6604 RepID=UPI0022E5EA0C|nr:perlucin-like protein [Mya arenaria]
MADIIRLCLSFLLFKGIYGNGVTLCPDRWLAFNGSCYYFGKGPFIFTEAEHYCLQHGAHLVKVETEIENSFLKDVLSEFTSRQWWLGMTEELVPGHWKWVVDDSEANYFDWAPGQPNPHGEECAIFFNTPNYQWADIPCTHSLWDAYALCEKRGQIVNPECMQGNIVG